MVPFEDKMRVLAKEMTLCTRRMGLVELKVLLGHAGR